MLNYKDKELTEKIKVILNVFSGEDGGMNFIQFCQFVHEMEEENSYAGNQLLLVIKRFGKLLENINKTSISLEL